MNNLVLAIAMIVAAIGGYFVGSWSGRDAKEALARVEASGAQQKADYDKAVKSLQGQLATLGAEHAQREQQIQNESRKQEVDFKAAVATRDQRINDLVKKRSDIQTELAKAKARAAAAATPEEKAAANQAVAQLEKTESVVNVTVQGEECANVKVPPSLLAALKGGQP